jgi:hypothetical protein
MEPKIRQLIPACLFGARLWNQSGKPDGHRNYFSAERAEKAIGAIAAGSDEPKAAPRAGNLGFPRALLTGRKGRKVQCSDILPFLALWPHLQPHLLWPNNLQLRDR